jgi:chitinase
MHRHQPHLIAIACCLYLSCAAALSTQLYASDPTKPSWDSASWSNGRARTFGYAVDPDDPWVDAAHGTASFSVDGSGTLTATGSVVRWYVHDPKHAVEFSDDLEITTFIMRVSESQTVSYGGLQVFARTNHGTIGSENTNDCDTRGVAGKVLNDGRWSFEKETSHRNRGYADPGAKRPWTALPKNEWVGVKYVLFVNPDGTATYRLYRAITPGSPSTTEWELIYDFTESGSWGAGYPACKTGVNPALVHRRDALVAAGSETGKPCITVIFRCEYCVMKFKETSVRSIVPPNKPLPTTLPAPTARATPSATARATPSATAAPVKPALQRLVIYNDNIAHWWPPTAMFADLGVPGYAEQPYNYLLWAFWQTTTGPADIAELWNRPTRYFGTDTVFGSTDESIRTGLLSKFHEAGKKVLVSAFGANDLPDSKDATTVCRSLGQYVLDTKLDGVDLDYENSAAMEAGTAEDWLITCTRVLRSMLPREQGYIITHAPQAPYFMDGKYPKGAYKTIHATVGDLIDWYNIQFYNQDTTRYDTYDTAFVRSTGWSPGTAVYEIADRCGVPLDKIVFGKPASPGAAYNTGYVAPATLQAMVQKAQAARAWNAGVMFWQYRDEQASSFAFGKLLSSNAAPKPTPTASATAKPTPTASATAKPTPTPSATAAPTPSTPTCSVFDFCQLYCPATAAASLGDRPILLPVQPTPTPAAASTATNESPFANPVWFYVTAGVCVCCFIACLIMLCCVVRSRKRVKPLFSPRQAASAAARAASQV